MKELEIREREGGGEVHSTRTVHKLQGKEGGLGLGKLELAKRMGSQLGSQIGALLFKSCLLRFIISPIPSLHRPVRDSRQPGDDTEI